jgi:hypothetical protein
MEVTTTTLYYNQFSLPGVTPIFSAFYLLGRALTQEEYENITADELRSALCHCPYLGRPPLHHWRWIIAGSADQLKDRLRTSSGLLIRLQERLFREEFPLITKGPRKGYPNFKKAPERFQDRLYHIAYLEDGTVPMENQRIELADDGSFKVLNPQLMGGFSLEAGGQLSAHFL